MTTAPLISVLLPVRNGAAYLDEALESLVAQTLKDFEIIAVDDGSTDDTPQRLQAWVLRDARLRVLRLAGVGPAGALNAAIAVARGHFFARMDADDICMPERFAEQVAYLRDHPAVGVCGTWVKTFGAGRARLWKYPENDDEICARLLFSSPFAHPATMIRKTALDKLGSAYLESAGRAEDYDLWVRLSAVCAFGNVGRVLLRYRFHPDQVTVRERDSSLAGAGRARNALLSAWWPESSEGERIFHHKVCSDQLPLSRTTLDEAERWLAKMNDYNLKTKIVSEKQLREDIAMKWWDVCRHFRAEGIYALVRFLRSPLLHWPSIPLRRWGYLIGVTMVIQIRRMVRPLSGALIS